MIPVVLVCVVRVLAYYELMDQVHELHVLSPKESFELTVVSVVFG